MRDRPRPAPSFLFFAVCTLGLAPGASPGQDVLPPPPPPAAAPAPIRAVRAIELRPALMMPGGAAPAVPAAPPAAAPPPAPPAEPIIHLTSDGFATGDLVASPDPGQVRWRSPAFAAPLVFAASGVEGIRWPAPPRLPEPSGAFRFDLAGGDVLFGDLAGLDDSVAEVETSRLGRIHLERSKVARMVRRGGATRTVYSGPNGLVGWEESETKDAWRVEAGRPYTDRAGATLHADLGLPARAVVEFELSWKAKADFVLALGVGEEGTGSLAQSTRFEVWDGKLVVGRELDSAADVAALRAIPDGPGRIHLLAYLDQVRGSVLVVAPDGTPLGDLTVNGPDPRAWPGVTLVNVRGDVRLDRIQITPWDGTPPREAEAGRSRIHRTDGTVVRGKITGFDAASRAFVLDGEAGEARIEADQVADVFLGNPTESPARPAHAVFADGTRISCALPKVEAGALELTIPGVREAPRVPIDSLLSLTLSNAASPPPELKDGLGLLELDGVRLPGHMTDARADAEASSLSWRPEGSVEATPLRPKVSGRVFYKAPKPATPALARRTPTRVVNGLNALIGAFARPDAPGLTARRMLHLRTGDAIPCEVTSIDQAGVRFTSTQCPSTFVPHSSIKAIEMAVVQANPIKLSKAKRERLLTLPRMQKDSPPTQLIRSTNGDYLRGRVLALDADTLRVETRLETKAVPRDRVARIIWLHADEATRPKPPAGPPAQDGPWRVQGVQSDGIRLTFRPEACADGVLSGKSDVLGECRVRLGDLEQLLIGGAIERSAAESAYARWSLHQAEEPKFVKDDGSGGAGTESALVGKAAPDFTLDLLDGKPFHLAEAKGHVVVLDFWATWCGPCLQAMPQVDRATKAFQDRGVQLVAVNLQEESKAITAMLERHKFDMAVALDRDGVVADRYGATAIPQTVIIGADGVIARLFVGGGPDFEDQLRESLGKLVGDAAALPPKAE